MLIALAPVETERPSRYLVQLCRHVNHVNEAAPVRPEMQPPARWSDAHGVISVGSGRCILDAEPGALMLRRFGRRDRLTVTWRRD